MPLVVATWWRGDPRPKQLRSAGLTAYQSSDDAEMALLQGSFESAVAARRDHGSVPYVARLHGETVAFVWVARRCGHVGSHGLSFDLPEGDRYLWDLSVLDAGRPLQAGSQLLRAVIDLEKARRFWIAAARDALPDLERAGFKPVAEMYRLGGEARFEVAGDAVRAAEAALLLGLPATTAPKSGCSSVTAA